jgi:hypothetical protein
MLLIHHDLLESRSAERKHLIESSDEEVADSESHDGDDESEDPEPIR